MKEDLHDRMKAIRAAAGHQDLTHAERCLLVVLVTYQNFKDDPIYAKGWMVARRRLSEELYGRADKTTLRLLDRRLVSLQKKGFIRAISNGRRANTWAVSFDRLHVHSAERGSSDARSNTSDGPTDHETPLGSETRPPLGSESRQMSAHRADPPRLTEPTSSTEYQDQVVETTPLPVSGPKHPGGDECVPASPDLELDAYAHEDAREAFVVPARVGWLVERFGMLDVELEESQVEAVVAAFSELDALFAGMESGTQSTALRMVTNIHHQDPVGAVGWVQRLVESMSA